MPGAWGRAELKVIDCDSTGLILEDRSMLGWAQIEVFGKCEYPGRELPWLFYYLRKKGGNGVVTVSCGGPELRLKIYESGKGNTRFVVKTTHFGPERPMPVEKEMELARYHASPEAKKAQEDYQKLLPGIIIGFVTAVVLSLLALFTLG
ncbi:MAG: hypothetical protein Q8R76_00385 [Candidatus Omnitrophota bacterium]|nr:hypothetical protein [Candidatus Omnitrophota bacterium]